MEKDKYIEVTYGNFSIAKQTGGVQIRMRDDNGKPFIATLYNDGFQPKTSPFSGCNLILVKYKVLSQLSQPIFILCSY